MKTVLILVLVTMLAGCGESLQCHNAKAKEQLALIVMQQAQAAGTNKDIDTKIIGEFFADLKPTFSRIIEKTRPSKTQITCSASMSYDFSSHPVSPELFNTTMKTQDQILRQMLGHSRSRETAEILSGGPTINGSRGDWDVAYDVSLTTDKSELIATLYGVDPIATYLAYYALADGTERARVEKENHSK